MNSQAAVEAKISQRLAEAYLRDPGKIARLCDEEIDRSGNLLGWLREAASSLPLKDHP